MKEKERGIQIKKEEERGIQIKNEEDKEWERKEYIYRMKEKERSERSEGEKRKEKKKSGGKERKEMRSAKDFVLKAIMCFLKALLDQDGKKKDQRQKRIKDQGRKCCAWKKAKVESDVYGKRKQKVMCLEEGESRK